MKTMLAALLCTLLLTGCGPWDQITSVVGIVSAGGSPDYASLVLGRWENEGIFVSWAGENGGTVTALTFLESGQLVVETAEDTWYEYDCTMTDDTLTIQQENIAYCLPYETDGDTLTLGPDGADGIYDYDALAAKPEE